MDALNRAVDIAGGQSQLALAIECIPQTVHNWLKRGRVPAEYCPRIERVTGVRCEDLRPDVDWAYLRATDCAVKVSHGEQQEAA